MIIANISVRKRLTRDLILLILILLTIFLSFSYFYAKQVQNDITQAIMSSAKNSVIAETHRIFDPISNNLILSRKWAELEELTAEKQSTFNKRFIPILETLPQISAVILASSEGEEYFFTRQDDHWLSRHISPAQYADKDARWQQWNSNNQSLKKWQEKTDYVSKNRPWYKLGLTTNEQSPIKWTTPYSFYTLKTPGVTGVTHWKNSKGVQYVLAFDVTLSEVAKLLSAIKISNNDIAYLVSPTGEVILPPGNKHIIKGSSPRGSLYVPGDDNSNYVIFDSVNNWLKNKRQLDKVGSFSRDGQLWWYKIFSLDSYHNTTYAGIIVPERELLDIFSDNLILIAVGTAVLLLLALLMANILVKKYAHQLKDVPKTNISMENFDEEIYSLLRAGESETLEFKSTMRKNLKANRNGKEIEIAWLKGLVAFMNTKGGILLIGVDDDSQILGLESDEFENEDKMLLHFKNLLNQHIGMEYSQFINPVIWQGNDVDNDNKSVLVIECERADKPAFLRHKQNEDFYIRSGPSSINLTIREVLRYVQNRY